MKSIIADTFFLMVQLGNIDKITVKALIDACHISRQTFYYHFKDSVKEMSRAGPKKGAQNQPCQPRSFQGMSEKEEKFKQNQVQ